jgi:hypothetical protein
MPSFWSQGRVHKTWILLILIIVRERNVQRVAYKKVG